MRRQFGVTSLAALLALALPLSAQEGAQGTNRPVSTSQERGDTVRIIITGKLELDYVYRAAQVTAFTDSFSNPTGAGAVPGSEGEDTFEGEWAVRFTAELSNKVTVIVEVGTLRVDGSPSATGTGGDQDGIRRYGTSESVPIDLRDAQMIIHDLFLEGLELVGGTPGWSFNPRGQGGSMAFDPRRSQTVTRNLDSDGTFTLRDNGDARLAEAAFVDELLPVGAVLTYNRASIQVDLVLLPAVIEGGATGDGEAMYALDVLYKLDALGKGSQFGIIIALFQADTNAAGVPVSESDAEIWTFGTGGTLKLADGAFEVFAEGYLQRGVAGYLAGSGQTIYAKGSAYTLGVQYNYTVGNPMPIWIGASFTSFSGERDEDPGDHTAERFAGYESLNDLLVMEDSYYGFDWDSNYQAFKIWLGTRVSTARKDDLELNAILGVLEATEKVLTPGGDTNDELGYEIDFRIRWHLSKQAVLHASLGLLFGNEILKESMLPDVNPDASANTQVFVLGMDLNF